MGCIFVQLITKNILYASVRHTMPVLPIAPVVFGLLFGCSYTQNNRFDVQKNIVSLGVPVHQISIYPPMLTPFLDENHAEEAKLKNFLKTVDNVQIYRLPTKLALDGFAERLDKSAYAQLLNVERDGHCLKIYSVRNQTKVMNSLILLLSKSAKVRPDELENSSYCIEVSGNISKPELVSLTDVNPAFFDHYIRRFNIQF
jgi:hypothetical protein